MSAFKSLGLLAVVGLVVSLSGCGCGGQPPCSGDACVDGGSGGGTGGGSGGGTGGALGGGTGGGDTDAGAPWDAGAPDAGWPAPVLQDYLRCRLDIDCPAGFGRCVTTLPLHHADPKGNLAVSAAQVFGLDAGVGLCGITCEGDPGVCGTSPNLSSALSYSCQVVYAAPSPYDAGVASDPARMRLGTSFAAMCRPAMGGGALCGPCSTDDDCHGGTCWDLFTDAPYGGGGSLGTCVTPCAATGAACPGGFTCSTRGAAQLCLPTLGTCGACADRDHDGFGTGFCGPENAQNVPTLTAVDCNENDATAYWGGSLSCGATDHDCNGFSDATDMVGTDQYGLAHCSACGDTCPSPANQGVVGVGWACVGPTGNRSCVATCVAGFFDCDGDAGCEVGPTTAGHQFAPDQDGDGYACNPAPGSSTCAVVTACTLPSGYAAAHAYSATPGSCALASCPDADEAHGAVHPLALEVCDGLDNDQNGKVDEGFAWDGGLDAGPDLCTNGALPVGGLCASGVKVRSGAGCVATCGATVNAGTWQCFGTGGVRCLPNTLSTEIACNGLDDNCNGQVDEPLGDSCTWRDADAGMDSPCWQKAKRDCTGKCVAATENHAADIDLPGDNFDSDCDGKDTQGDAIYLWPGSNSASVPDGGRLNPFKSYEAAAAAAATRPTKTLYVQQGSTPVLVTAGPVQVGAGTHLIGGFGGGTSWTWAPTAKTSVCLPPGGAVSTWTQYVSLVGTLTHAGWVGLRCTSANDPAKPAVVSNLDLQVAATGCAGASSPLDTADAGMPLPYWGLSSYGAIFTDCDEVVLRNLSITANTPPTPPVPDVPPQAATGADGAQTVNSAAGGVGGHGANVLAALPSVNGSTTAPTATADTKGGAAGGAYTSGSAPAAAAGPTGQGGAAPRLASLLPKATPDTGAESYALTKSGYLIFNLPGDQMGALGQMGGRGPGGGGGGYGLTNFAVFTVGGAGAQGGGSGRYGQGGAAGGDTIGLVLLGSQLPTAACAQGGLLSCGENVSITAQAGGRGGHGGVGGKGGPGGSGQAGGGGAAGAGGAGGPGCGGGGGAGGRGGVSLALARDLASLGTNNPPSWLVLNANLTQANGNQGGGPGVVGSALYTCADPSGGTTGADGPAGAAYLDATVPMLGCGDAKTVDPADYVPNTSTWVMATKSGTTLTASPSGTYALSASCP